jgi:hypothetical protein
MTAPSDTKDRVYRAKCHINHLKKSDAHDVDPNGRDRVYLLLNALIDFAPTPEGSDRVAQSVIDCQSFRDLVELCQLYETYVIFPSECKSLLLSLSTLT